MIDKLSWMAVHAEIVLLCMTCLIMLFDLSVSSAKRSLTHAATLITLAGLAVLEARYALMGETVYGFGRMVVSDSMAHWLKCFASIATLFTLIYGRAYAVDRDMLSRGGELFTLNLFALLGMFIMISGNHFLVIYLGLELMALSSYALVALRRDHAASSEAAMKYFVLGALASGFLLYGLSMLYGATGTLEIGATLKAIATGQIQHQVLVFGVVFLVAGLAFKLALAPFHMWAPDVYQGAPTVVTLMIAGAPKLAAFAMVMRLLVEGLLPLAMDWQQMLAVLAVTSLLVGNLAAIAQTNLKRMLAFSTIAQMGFMVLGLLAGVINFETSLGLTANAYSSAMFYVVTYVLTTLAVFGVIMILARQGFECEEISDLSGLHQRSPLYAGVLALCLFSLAGIPPLVGFYAKLAVLQALLVSQQGVYIGLAVFAVIMSLIGAFYYLRVIKVMYFDAPLTQEPVPPVSREVSIALTVNMALVLGFSFLPSGLMQLCIRAIGGMLIG